MGKWVRGLQSRKSNHCQQVESSGSEPTELLRFLLDFHELIIFKCNLNQFVLVIPFDQNGY
uniref:Uncharacterized protein n=1 Tax=Solanum tuberosum TaxID=4113 RepID=M1BP52_SOLTU